MASRLGLACGIWIRIANLVDDSELGFPNGSDRRSVTSQTGACVEDVDHVGKEETFAF